MNKLLNIIKSSILCLRFPFLYPRNRFTGRHKANALQKPLYKLFKRCILPINITAELQKEEYKLSKLECILGIDITLDIKNKKLTIKNDVETKEHSLSNLLCRDDRFIILGMRLSFGLLTGKPNIIIVVKPKNSEDTTNYGFGYEEIKLITNKFKYKLYKILKWIDSNILDRLLFLPSYTELNAMEPGWRKAFGIQMCKDIKKALKKHKGFLKRYRILQIKEKFGVLEWYSNLDTEETKKVISKYARLSRETCIDCGKPAEYISCGYISPYCNNCKMITRDYIPITEENAWDKAYTYYWPKDEEE